MDSRYIIEFVNGKHLVVEQKDFMHIQFAIEDDKDFLITKLDDEKRSCIISMKHIVSIIELPNDSGSEGVVTPPTPDDLREREERERLAQVSSLDSIIERGRGTEDDLS
jgi:hypothetical protein